MIGPAPNPTRLLVPALAIALAAALATAEPRSAGADAADPRATEVVYVATGANFPDALGAGPAAALGNGPILLVQTDAVPSPTTVELNRLQPRLIVIVGGTAVVSTGVEATLKGLSFGPTVIRLSGSNRYATAAAISASAFPCRDGTEYAGTTNSGKVCRTPLSGKWNSQTVDSALTVGKFPSITLDGFGNPVIAYYDQTNTNLKLAHCNDPACSGSGESVLTVISLNDDGQYASLALDASGNPVIAYYDATFKDLYVTHCTDPECSGAKSVEIVDYDQMVGTYLSMVLDAAGNPVIAYYDDTFDNLKLAHCNDPNCAGGNEQINAAVIAGTVGLHTSLVLDAAGNPVISYYDASTTSLKVVHCNDPNCADGDDVPGVVDSTGSAGQYTSLALDGAGNPVIAYYKITTSDLKVAHCNDPNCAGGDESIQTVDSAGAVGSQVTLVLGPSGVPTIAYYDATNSEPKVARCNDPNCAGDDETISRIILPWSGGSYMSMVLDAGGNPVIAYYDGLEGDLEVASG